MSVSKVVMIGHRRLPAAAGGIDRHVEELSATLVEQGLRVTCVGFGKGSERGVLRGVQLHAVKSPRIKGLEALFGTLYCVLWALRSLPRDTIVHLHGGAAAMWTWIPRMTGRRVVSTVHALYWREQKWGRLGRALLRIGEGVTVKSASAVIAVSQPVADWILLRWGREAYVVPSGVRPSHDEMQLRTRFEHDLPTEYVLFCGRLIRDRRVEDLIRAAGALEDCPTVVVAGPPEDSDPVYSEWLREIAGDNCIFLGEVTPGEALALMRKAAVMVNPSIVEGLSIAVLEAMAMGCPLLLSDISENRAAAGTCAMYFRRKDHSDLRDRLSAMLSHPDLAAEMAARGVQRSADLYDWGLVASSVAAVYEGRSQY